MQQVQALDPDRDWATLAVILTDDEGMPDFHRAAFQSEKNTDVISYAYPPGPAMGPGYHGEIVVNVERALQVGPRYDGPEHELALYIAHGCQHLTGADDATPQERRTMRRVERKWLALADAQGLLNGLLRT